MAFVHCDCRPPSPKPAKPGVLRPTEPGLVTPVLTGAPGHPGSCRHLLGLCTTSAPEVQRPLCSPGWGAWAVPLRHLTAWSPGTPHSPAVWHCPRRVPTGLQGTVCRGLVQTELALFRPSGKNGDPPAHEPPRPRAGPVVAPHAQDRGLVSRAPDELAVFSLGDALVPRAEREQDR